MSIISFIIMPIGKFILKSFDYLVFLHEGNKTFYEEKEYPSVAILRENYSILFEEYQLLKKKTDIPGIEQYFEEQKVLSSKKSWKSFPFFIFGKKLNENCDLCPATSDTLLKINNMSSAMYSILSANKTIKPHHGIYKGVVRVHLGLDVPDNCYIIVNGIKKEWENGELLLFDDVFEHSVYNYSNKDRAVLFIDVIKKLPFPLNILNMIIFNLLTYTGFIKNPINNFKNFGNKTSSKIKLNF